jgi:hypothetical protein
MPFHTARFDMRARHDQYRMVSGLACACLLVLLLVPCSKSLAPPASATPIPASALRQAADPQPVNFDACTIFSAADAAQILGVPVRPVTSVGGCSYEAAKETSGGWRRNTALNVYKYKSAADETSAWSDQKILHHFEPGRKNLTVVNGIGSEAYLQIVPDRKVFEGTIWVHKNSSHFRLIVVSEQNPAPEVLKTTAQKVAAKLP